MLPICELIYRKIEPLRNRKGSMKISMIYGLMQNVFNGLNFHFQTNRKIPAGFVTFIFEVIRFIKLPISIYIFYKKHPIIPMTKILIFFISRATDYRSLILLFLNNDSFNETQTIFSIYSFAFLNANCLCAIL